MRSLALLMPLLLVACDTAKPIRSICEDHPELCADLNSDGWCRYERADVIRSRFELITANQQQDLLRYRLLVDLEEYSDCIRLAAGITHHKSKEKQSDRGSAYLNSLAAIKKRQAEIKDSTEPHLLYYRLSRFGDMEAQRAFLALEGTGALDSLELKEMLASYYSKLDRPKTIRLLLEALSLKKKGDEVSPDIYHSLASLSQQERRFREAYVWALISKESGVLDTNFNLLEGQLLRDQKLLGELGKRADRILDAIQDNAFTPELAMIDHRQ
ncbi:DUF2989 domain-containing protein [Gallaecimonas sp. GXIMD4217]|uniref:DUF2989 domain-containing protein n=1 Tax=Gallaecimonas sp. GXIMD4217 TaxID=3131927 RepID=UPI00311B10B6